jgi:putative salt-induced outer membrane protein YdiY
MTRRIAVAVALCSAALFSGAAHAQATMKTDGKWRYALGAGASLTSGNSDSTMLNLNGDAVRATEIDRWSLRGRLLYGRNNGDTTDDLLELRGRYDRNFNTSWFGFGSGEFLRDRPANLSGRGSVATGVGYHVFKTDENRWDVFGGVGYSHESYYDARVVAGELRSSYDYGELLAGEESTHRLTDTTTFKQRFVLYPNLSDSGQFRAALDAGLAVAINKTLSLTMTLSSRYNSDPGEGLDNTDTSLVAGLSVKID